MEVERHRANAKERICVWKALPVLHEMRFDEITKKKERGRRYRGIDLQFRIDFNYAAQSKFSTKY